MQRIGVTGGFEAHINFLEAVACLFGLRMALPYCRGRVRCFIDNQAVVGMLHRLTSRCSLCLPVIKEITLLLSVHGCEAIPIWLESAANTAADALSRDHLGYDWRGIIAEWNAHHPDTTHWHQYDIERPDLLRKNYKQTITAVHSGMKLPLLPAMLEAIYLIVNRHSFVEVQALCVY
eukprot:COSAG01_NODE_18802_length_1052_cov_1.344176_1_plen_176_part_10